MEPRPWVPRTDRHGKGLLWRPRRDRDEDYTLRLFDADCTHAEASRAFGGERRIVAALLIHPDASFEVWQWKDQIDGLPAIVERIEPRLKRRSDFAWDFTA